MATSRGDLDARPHALPPSYASARSSWTSPACRSNPWGDLKIEGYIKGKLVITRTLSGSGVDAQLLLEPDDRELVGDGSDATRVVIRIADEYGNTRPFATGAVTLAVEGPGEIVGENPFAVPGGAGAVWVKSKPAAGVVRLRAKHPYLAAKKIEITVKAAPPESV